MDLHPIAEAADDADPGLARIAAQVRALPREGTAVVGITGGVAAGKSVLAERLAARLSDEGQHVEIVGTDGFLHPNTRLTELGLLEQKGFPPSYDTAALAAALRQARQGPTTFPAYSHSLYDIDPSLARILDRPDVLIVEGLNLRRPGAAEAVDLLIYLDAEEAHLEAWYVERFLGLWEAAAEDPTSFYARFRHLDREGVTGVAKWVWESVNLPNLRQHIAPGRDEADLVAHKGLDHRLDAIGVRAGAADVR